VSVITETAVTVIVRQPTVPIAIATVVTFNVLNVYLLALSPHNVPTVQVLIVTTVKAKHIYRPIVIALVAMLVTVMKLLVIIVVRLQLPLITVTVRVTAPKLFVPNYIKLV
jgi:hypothetical protein